MTSARTFALPGGRVSVRCEVRGFAGWLAEVLCPGFAGATPEAADPSVVVVPDPPDARAAEPLGPVPCFRLDNRVVHHPAWRNGVRVEVFDEQRKVCYAIGPDAVTVHPRGEWPRTRVALLRLVRELVTAQSLADGRRIELHACGVNVAGRVVLVAGPKESGKTTLLCHVASSTRAAVVSNDRVLLSPPAPHGTAWDVRAVPTIVSVRPGTMTCLPHLFRSVPALPSPAHLTLAESDEATRRAGTVDSPRLLRLSLPQLGRAVGAPLSSGGPLAAVAVLTRDDGCAGFRLRPLAAGERERGLSSVRYGASTDHGPTTIFERFVSASRPAVADKTAVRRLASEVHCVELRVGPSFLDSQNAAADLLAELAGA